MMSTVSAFARRLLIPGFIACALLLAPVALTPVQATSAASNNLSFTMTPATPDLIDDPTDGRVGILELNEGSSASYAGLKIFYYAEIQFDKGAELVLLDGGEPYPVVRMSSASNVYRGQFSIEVREPGKSPQTLTVENGTFTVYPSRAAAEDAVRSK